MSKKTGTMSLGAIRIASNQTTTRTLHLDAEQVAYIIHQWAVKNVGFNPAGEVNVRCRGDGRLEGADVTSHDEVSFDECD